MEVTGTARFQNGRLITPKNNDKTFDSGVESIESKMSLFYTTLDYYGLESHIVEFIQSARTYGRCYYYKDRFDISEPILSVEHNMDRFADMIIHEIAHYLVFKETGSSQHHNYIWKCKARDMGGSGNRLTDITDLYKAIPNYKYVAHCDCMVHYSIKKKENRRCRHCKKSLTYMRR